MKVLVTGGSGFIGRNLCEFLKGVGAEVVDYSRRNGCDIFDYPKLKAASGEVDLVVHLAAYAKPNESKKKPYLALRTNTEGALNILEACREHRFTLIYISTCEVYGNSTTPITEEHLLHPPNPYAASKASTDMFCLGYYNYYDGLDIKVLRLFNAYGPHQQLNKIIPRFYINAKQGLPLPVYGAGADYRDYTYIGDIVRGIWQARSLPAGEVVNFCTGIPTTNLELARKVLALTGSKSEIAFTEYPKPFSGLGKQIGSPEKARRLLGWKARSLDEGLRETAKWLDSVQNRAASTSKV